jgi:short-subunit dehydrogenase
VAGLFICPMKNIFYLFWAIIVLYSSGCCSTSKLSKSGQRKTAGKTFVIIGASSGFGKGTALQLGAYHANVVLAARRTDLLEDVAKQVREAGGTALVVTTDISKPEDVQKLADEAVAKYGHIDVWINDVGVGAIGRFWEIPLADQNRLIDVNLKGIINGSYIATKLFTKQKSGTLINLGSIDSEVPLAYQGSYAASKAGVRSLGESLNQELRLAGYDDIKVVTIEPWAVDSPWWGHAANYSGGTPRMALMDGPEKVVNAIIWSSLHRRKEVQVGWKAKFSYVFHHMMPHFSERFTANVAHKYQIETAPPAPNTDGSLFKPMPTGTGVDNGVRARMKKEKEDRKQMKADTTRRQP